MLPNPTVLFVDVTCADAGAITAAVRRKASHSRNLVIRDLLSTMANER